MSGPRSLGDAGARARFLHGAAVVARAVGATLGPGGRTVLIERPGGPPAMAGDGADVAEGIELSDRIANLGAGLLRQAALDMKAAAGDGSATATLLAHALLAGGIRAASSGLDAAGIRRGIDRAARAAATCLARSAVPMDPGRAGDVAAIAAGGDRAIGRLVADARAAVGKDGLVLAEAGNAVEDRLETAPGMRLDRGYAARAFADDGASGATVLANPQILLCDRTITSLLPLLPLLDHVAAGRRPLLIITPDVVGEALAMLVVNRKEGGLKVAAVRAPGTGSHRAGLLEDIAVLTGATVVPGGQGSDFGLADPAVLGRAERVRITAALTDIIGGAGDRAAIARRRDHLRRLCAEAPGGRERTLLTRRLARLAGGVAVIRAGGHCQAAIAERRTRIERALLAVEAAAASGIVPGGGAALLDAGRALAGLAGGDCAEHAGIRVVADALAQPLRAIADNAGADGRGVVAQLAAARTPGAGFDAQARTTADMLAIGIADPAATVAAALSRAASVAATILTAEIAVPARRPRPVARHPFACRCSDRDHHHHPGDPYHVHDHG